MADFPKHTFDYSGCKTVIFSKVPMTKFLIVVELLLQNMHAVKRSKSEASKTR